MTDKQAKAAEPEVVVEGYGVRGKDFIEIWQAPRSPNEQVRVRTDEFAKFTAGLLATRTQEQEGVIASASTKGHYMRSDPDVRKPFVCRVVGCKQPKWFSADAFTMHSQYAHQEERR